MARINKEYPDISDILALKLAGRRQRAALSFSEKLDIVDALRERVQPIVTAREARRAGRATKQAVSTQEDLP
jgi:hypothetical protein